MALQSGVVAGDVTISKGAQVIQRIRDTNLKRLFGGVSLFAVAVTIVLGGYALSVNRSQNQVLDRSAHVFQVYNALQSSQTEITNARRGARTYLLYGDASGVEQYQQAMAAYSQQMAAVSSQPAAIDALDPAIRAQIGQIDAMVQEWQANDAEPSLALRQSWTGSDSELQAAAFEWSRSPDRQALFAAMLNNFGAVIGRVEEVLTKDVERVGTENTRLTRILVPTLSLMTLFAIIAAIFLYREIARPLERISRAARAIASGDLTARTGIHQRNEIGVAAESFDTMADQLQQLVSLRETAQLEIADRETRLRTILESVGDAILIVAGDGRIVDANSAASDLLGEPEAPLIEQPVDPMIPRASDMNLGGEFLELSDGAEKRDLTVTSLTGRSFPAEVTASRAQIKQSWHVVLCIRDISERVQAHEALRGQYLVAELNRQLVRSVIDAVNDVLLFIGLDDRVLFVNRRHQELLGIANAAMKNRTIDEIGASYAPVFGDADALIDLLKSPAIRADPPQPLVLAQTWPTERELLVQVLPVRSAEDNEPIGRLCTMRDISAEREADQLKSDFISLVSHELRTPLTSIKGYVDLLLDGEVGSLTAEQSSFLGIVAASSTRLIALTNDLLDISRVEAGHLDLNLIEMEIAPQLRSVIATLRPQIEAKEQRLQIDLPAYLPPVTADQNRFAQVLTNLVSNAHKYTDPGGQITIRVQQRDAMVRFEVVDTGAGLSADEQQRLFTRFYRARNRATQQVGGTGLGLAISKLLVEAQDGSIGVESELGVGSTFWFELPAVAHAAPSATGEPEQPHGDESIPLGPDPDLPGTAPARRPVPEGRVLVIEDDPDIAKLLQRYLLRSGYESEVSATGADGISRAISYEPNLITLDVALPDLDGFAVLERLRADPRSASIPVLFVSMLPATESSAAFGAVDYLTKPVNERQLISRIRGILAENGNLPILVADDDEATRSFLHERLHRAGYQVVEAKDGREALLISARQPLALAFIDVRMPVIDGIETLRRLRSLPATARLPVVMMTASPGIQDEHVAAIEQMGAMLHLGKHLSAEDVAQIISAQIVAHDRTNQSEPARQEGS